MRPIKLTSGGVWRKCLLCSGANQPHPGPRGWDRAAAGDRHVPGGTGQVDGHIHTQDKEGGADQVSRPTLSGVCPYMVLHYIGCGICPYMVLPYISCASYCFCSLLFCHLLWVRSASVPILSFCVLFLDLPPHFCLHQPSHLSSVFPSHFPFLSQSHSPPLTVKVDRPHLFSFHSLDACSRSQPLDSCFPLISRQL